MNGRDIHHSYPLKRLCAGFGHKSEEESYGYDYVTQRDKVEPVQEISIDLGHKLDGG